MALTSARGGGIKLFRLFGVDVSLHWLWFVLAFYEINSRKGAYTSLAWNIAEYCSLFLIVLLHEFGHALACKSVGGKADHIMLWPLGGVAFVRPPQRPGALLWSIVAGPLVNVVLIPVTVGALFLSRNLGASHDVVHFFRTVAGMNVVLLVFNLFPIYPLDGGQIVQALLWFVIGQARSLLVASIIGFIGAAGVLALALWLQEPWFIVLAIFGAMQSMRGFNHSRALSAALSVPKHEQYHCPSCKQSPPAVPLWKCACGTQYDTFATGGACPACGRAFPATQCPRCGEAYPFALWAPSMGFPVTVPPPSVTMP
jgi:Zn-dependent protease